MPFSAVGVTCFYYRWNCKYHMVLMPQYYRNIIYGRLRKDRGKTIMDAA